MTVLQQVKSSLGITSNSRDADIQLAIDSAVQQMQMMGVENVFDNDPHTVMCIIMYCRGFFNFQGDGDRYSDRFERMANGMALAQEYRGEFE